MEFLLKMFQLSRIGAMRANLVSPVTKKQFGHFVLKIPEKM